MSELETSIDLHVEDLDLLIAKWRLETVGVASKRVPPHITLLYPWRSAPLKCVDIDALQAVLEGECAFQIRFTGLRRFGDHTLYLEPEPNEVLLRIMRNLMTAFPETPPYGGEIEMVDPVPHLTIAKANDHQNMERLEREVSDHLLNVLPIEVNAQRVVVMQERVDGDWENHTVLLLA